MVRLKLKQILQERNISMGKLSRISDVSYSSIARMSNDPAYSPTLNMLERIAKALNVSVSDLYEEIPDTE
jgi:DNA-binding Xre family transcriptional regulator